MPKNILCCLMTVLGLVCSNSVLASVEGLSNTAYLSAHEVKKMVIGRSFSNCQKSTVSPRYIGLKTCASANVSDVYYMVTDFFHHTATQLFSKKTVRLIDKAGLKFSVAYKEKRTNLSFMAHF